MSRDDLRWLADQGFEDLRQVGGVWCATHDYLTTRGLVVDLTRDSYARRYCYQDRREATEALAAYGDTNEHPRGLWIKVKGTFRGRSIDALNPAWPARQPWDEVAS